MGKKGLLSDSDTAKILRRYSAVTIMGLLREIARCDNAMLDWKVLVRKSSTGISSAREYQALWRHIAYRAELGDCYADDAIPAEDESDLEFELLPSPDASADTNAEVVRWVKADMQRFGVIGKKKGDLLSKSKSKEAGLSNFANQGRISAGFSGSPIDVTKKAAIIVTAADQNIASPPGTASQVAATTPQSSPAAFPRVGGQSERKKRKLWSSEEDQELIAAVEKFGEGNWTNILKGAFTHDRTAAQLSQRWALIRKRREVQAAANKLTSGTVATGSGDGQGSGMATPDTSLRTNLAEDGGNPVSIASPLLLSAAVGNESLNHVVPARTAMEAPVSQNQVHVSSPSTALGGSARATCSAAGGDSSAMKGGVGRTGGTSMRGMSSSQRQAQAVGTARNTSGSSTIVTVTAAGQLGSAGAGAGRLIAPGALVMSAAAAQAASVGGSEMWQAATLPSAGLSTCAPATKYGGRSTGVATSRSMSMKPLTGPDPGVQAAAVAAGARIAPASAAASLLKAAQSGNVVHIGPGGVPVTKSGLSSPASLGHNASGGSRGSGSIHYICTSAGAPPSTAQGMMLSGQRSVQQSKNQATTKSLGTNQTNTLVPTTSACPTSSSASTRSLPSTSQPN